MIHWMMYANNNLVLYYLNAKLHIQHIQFSPKFRLLPTY